MPHFVQESITVTHHSDYTFVFVEFVLIVWLDLKSVL